MSSLNLVKGQNLSLTKDNPTLTSVKIGLGWDANAGNGGAFDLDASAILLNSSGKVVGPQVPDSVVFFGNLKLKGVEHSGDNLTGAGDGDDETLTVNINAVPTDVEKVVFVVNIYQAESRGQNFGQVKNAYIRAYDGVTNAELAKYDLSEDHSASTGVTMGEMYRHDGGWKFKAIGTPVVGDLNAIVATYC